MKKISFWAIPLIAIGVLVFILFFLIDINPKAPKEIIENSSNIKRDYHDIKNKSSWLEKLGFENKSGTQYPINELTINIDLENSLIDERYYLVTSIYDINEIKKIKQLLDESLIAFVVENIDDNSSFIKIESENLAQLQMVETKLKHYNISAKLVTEER